MPARTSCPDRQCYERLLQGVYPPEEELANLVDHLEQCPSCAALVATLPSTDSFANLVAGADQLQLPQADALATRLTQILVGLNAGCSPPEPAFTQLGPYRVVRELGRGGMGVVLLAEDPALGRQVALKVMRAELANQSDARRRFTNEARAMAAIEHDHIVPVYHVGQEGAAIYLVMPFLRGESLEERLKRERKLPLPHAIRIIRQMALGLDAAHTRGLIHRDVKPGNVWLEEGTDRVKLLDFGLARVTMTEAGTSTATALIGTPAYMAPEQAAGQKADARSDLFSLGCVLYRLLTGRMPFEGAHALAVLRAVALEQPPAPHTVDPTLPVDLSLLTMRLLAKEPAHRPESAREVVSRLQELEQRLKTSDGSTMKLEASARQPTGARGAARPNPTERRPRRRAVLVVSVGMLLLIGGVFAVFQGHFNTAQGTLLVQVDDPIVEARFKGGVLQLFDPEGELLSTLEPGEREKSLPPGAYRLKVAGVDGLILDTDAFTLKKGDQITVRIMFRPLDHTVVSTGPPLYAGALVSRPIKMPGVKSWALEIAAHQFRVDCLATSPDGKWLASAGGDNNVRIWTCEEKPRLVRVLRVPEEHTNDLAWSADSKCLATAGTGCLTIWDVATGSPLHFHRGVTRGYLSWSPDGKRLIHGDYFYNPDSGKYLNKANLGRRVVYSPDGQFIVSATDEGLVRVWDARTLKHLRDVKVLDKYLGAAVTGDILVFAPNSDIVAYQRSRDTKSGVWLIDVRKGEIVWHYNHQVVFGALGWSRDGRLLALALPSDSKTGMCPIIVVDGKTGQQRQVVKLTGGFEVVTSLAWSSDGNSLIAGNGHGDLRYFDTASGKNRHTIAGSTGQFRHLLWLSDGKTLLADAPMESNPKGVAQHWNLAEGKLLKSDHVQTGYARSPDNRLLLNKGGRLIETGSQKVMGQLPIDWNRSSYAFSHDGKTIVIGYRYKPAIKFWDARTGKLVKEFEAKHPIFAVALTADNKTVAFVESDVLRHTRLFTLDITTGKRTHLADLESYTVDLSIAADGQWAMTTRRDFHPVVQIRSASGSKVERQFPTHLYQKTIAWSRDGKLLATANAHIPEVRLWEATTGRHLGTFIRMPNDQGLAITPEGHWRLTPGPANSVNPGIVYIVQTENGSTQTLTPDEMKQQFGWKNDPEKVRLLP